MTITSQKFNSFTLKFSYNIDLEPKSGFNAIILLFPEKSLPFPWKWEPQPGIVPLEEDYFDYPPITAALFPFLHGLTEFVNLTRENVASFQFEDLKVLNLI